MGAVWELLIMKLRAKRKKFEEIFSIVMIMSLNFKRMTKKFLQVGIEEL